MPAVSATMLGTWWHWTAHLPVGSSREEPNMMAGWMKWDCYLLLAATAVCPSSCTGPVYQICSGVEDGELGLNSSRLPLASQAGVAASQ